jgi:hypothetical protein
MPVLLLLVQSRCHKSVWIFGRRVLGRRPTTTLLRSLSWEGELIRIPLARELDLSIGEGETRDIAKRRQAVVLTTTRRHVEYLPMFLSTAGSSISHV